MIYIGMYVVKLLLGSLFTVGTPVNFTANLDVLNSDGCTEEGPQIGLVPEIVYDCQKRIDECAGSGTVIDVPELIRQQRNCFTEFRCRGKEDEKRKNRMLAMEQERMDILLEKEIRSSTSAAPNGHAWEKEIIFVLVIAVTILLHISSSHG